MVSVVVSQHFRVPQSPLFVPGDRPERFAKAVASGADAVILDFEDAVAPDRKAYARQQVQAFLHKQTHEIPVLVRINAARSEYFQQDLATLIGAGINALMLPKTESPDEVAAVLSAFAEPMPVLVLIESARGLANLSTIFASPGVCAAAFGSLDFALDLGCAHDWDALLLARSELVLRSRLAGLAAPLDGVTPKVDDTALIEADARRATSLGFGGKLAIHPAQIAAIRRGFAPDEASLAWARRVIAAAGDSAALKVDGAMVDEPVIERARRIIAAVSSDVIP